MIGIALSSRIREHIRSNAIGYLALFVALTIPPAWAASGGKSDLGRNDVHSKHIKPGNVRASDLGANAVDSSKIRDASIVGADVAADSLTSANIQGLQWSKLTGVPTGFADGVYPVLPRLERALCQVSGPPAARTSGAHSRAQSARKSGQLGPTERA